MSGRPFIPGLALGRMLYEEAARPIIEGIVPSASYAAALIGYGSDVMGFDSERSTDHNWGPRFQVFLSADVAAACTAAMMANSGRFSRNVLNARARSPARSVTGC